MYSKEIKDDKLFSKAKKLADDFAVLEGRRPRIMIAKLGQDGHDRGARIIATGFADVGFDGLRPRFLWHHYQAAGPQPTPLALCADHDRLRAGLHLDPTTAIHTLNRCADAAGDEDGHRVGTADRRP